MQAYKLHIRLGLDREEQQKGTISACSCKMQLLERVPGQPSPGRHRPRVVVCQRSLWSHMSVTPASPTVQHERSENLFDCCRSLLCLTL